MNALRSLFDAACSASLVAPSLAREPESPWEVRGFADLVPPATLAEARERRDELALLLGRERAAAADFLLALADFDRRRGWERLGYASLFAFLTRELGLSSGAAQLRLSAARLLPRHPAVEDALRSGRLCISAVGQLARVLTRENEADVLPRFLGRSAREAQEVAAALLPNPCPPRREVVTRVPTRAPSPAPAAPATAQVPPLLTTSAPADQPHLPPSARSLHTCEPQRPALPTGAGASAAAEGVLPALLSQAGALHTCEPQAPALPTEARAVHTFEVRSPGASRPRTPEVEPLSADLWRLHLNVSKRFLEKVAAARTGLSHAAPRATTEQVLEAALDLLLERQARRKALVKRPRRAKGATSAAATPAAGASSNRHEPALEPQAASATPTAAAASAARLTPTQHEAALELQAVGAPPTRHGPALEAHAAGAPSTHRDPAPVPQPSGRSDSPAPLEPRSIPAAIEREVRLRDGDRCQFPLDSGGVCGSTWRVELDHILPLALGGATTVANLRCACRFHNRYAAELALGEAVMESHLRR